MSPKKNLVTQKQLRAENESLREKIAELEQIIQALHAGAVDAIAFPSEQGDQIFTLQGAEHIYRVLIEEMNDGAVTMDTNGTILYCNQRFAKLLGVALNKVIGTSLADWLEPADRGKFGHLIQQVNIHEQRAEISLPGGDGKPLDVSLYAHLLSHGEMEVIYLVATDLTEYKNREAGLQHVLEESKQACDSLLRSLEEQQVVQKRLMESEEISRSVLNAVTETILMIDASGKILMANPAVMRRLGKLMPDLIGANLSDLLPAEIVSSRKALLAKVVQERQAVHFEDLFRGEVLEITIYPIVDADGEVRRMTLYGQNITQRRQAEESIRLQSAALNAAGNEIVITDVNGTIQWVNPAWCAVTGYAAEEAIGKNPRILQSGKHDPVFYEKMWNEILSGGIWHGEIINKRKDGTLFTEDMTVAPVLDSQGRITHFVGVKQDISERKNIEYTLRENQKRLATIFNASPLPIAISHIKDGRYIEVNEAFARFTDYTIPEVIDRTGLELGIWREPENRSRMYAELLDKGSLRDFEFQLYSKGGTQRDILLSAETVELNGELCALTIAQDITQRKRVEEALRENEEKYRGLMESLDNVVVTVDQDGRFLYMNHVAANQLGQPVEALVGKTMHELFPPAVAERQLEHIREAINNDQPLMYENASMVTGKPRWYKTTIQPIHDSNGRAIQALINSTDIHELKTIQQELQELNRTLEQRVLTATAEIQDLYNNAPAGYHSVDREGRIRFVNATELNWLGRSLAEVLGHSFTEFILPAQVEQFQAQHLQPVVSGQSVYDLEYDLLRPDGTPMTVLAQSEPVLDAEGRFVYSRGTLINITERKQADKKIRFQSKLLDVVGQAVIVTDTTGQVTYWNQAAEKIYGWKVEEALGRLITELTVPKLSEVQANQIMQALMNKQDWQGEFQAQRKDGSVFWIQIADTPIVDEQGNLTGLIGVSMDITKRKRAEAALQESEQRMELAFRAAQDGIWDWNIETDEVFYSSRWKSMLGYEGAELEPHVSAWQRLLHPDDLAQATQMVQAVLRGEREYIMEFRMKHKDGHYVDILSRGIPIRREPHGPIVRIVGTHFDLTERKRIEKALQDANSELEHAMRVKDEFLANMSHELRTPLSGILGMSEVLLMGYRGTLNERQHQFVTTIDSSAHHLLNLINDILDLAKLDADKLELKFETLSVTDICQSSLSFVKELATKKGLELELVVDPEAQLIQGDARRLKQILVNLLSNAVKFTATNGKVVLATHLAPNHQTLAFSVSDTGIGIAPADLARLFTPFTQVDNSFTRAHEGTGLGLSLVKRLVELHGGNISVESSVGYGSRFIVSLPWQAATSPVLPESNASVKSPSQLVSTDRKNLATILLVEDNPANIMFIGDYLDSLGYSMVYAYDGLAGLAKAVECVPQLILMDIQMPKLDGFETMRRLRADSQFAHTPIIALTASAMKGDAERCLQAGATDYLSKPVKLQELSEKIKRLLGA